MCIRDRYWISAFAGMTIEVMRAAAHHASLRLPPQLARQCARRMAEQFLHRSRIELVDALELLGMNAAGHEQAVDPETLGAGEIGAHGIPDRQHAVELDRMALAFRRQLHGALVDRPVRLAVTDHPAAGRA